MDNNAQPSFIPKRPLSQPLQQKPKRTVSFFSLIVTVIFITTLVISGLAFGVEIYLEKQFEQKKSELQVLLEKFEPSLVKELSRLESRIESAKTLLNQHLSLSTFFTALGNATLKNIRFSSFSYTADSRQISLSGQAQNFAAVALQQMEFQKPEQRKYFPSVTITDLNLDKAGNVMFRLSGQINPQVFSYAAVTQASGVTVSSTTPASALSTTTTNQ